MTATKTKLAAATVAAFDLVEEGRQMLFARLRDLTHFAG